MTFLRGKHGSRVVHLSDANGATLCGSDAGVTIDSVSNTDYVCWSCGDIAASRDTFEYPYAGIEEQIGIMLQRMPYGVYLRSRHWRWIRAVALDYYGGTCTLCGTEDEVQVHHRTYDRRGRETLADLTVLCDDCHARYHGKTAA
jgi:hypothetical protein